MGLLSVLDNARAAWAAVAPPIRDARRYVIGNRAGLYWSGQGWVRSQQRARVVSGQDAAWDIVDKIAPDDEDIFLKPL